MIVKKEGTDKMDLQKALQQFEALAARIRAYGYALSLAGWDIATQTPPKGKPSAAKASGILSGEMFQLRTSPEMKEILDTFHKHEAELTDVQRRETELLSEQLEKLEKIPKDEYQAMAELTSTAQFVWEEAKEKNDWSMFKPYLERIVATQKRFCQLTHPGLHPYEACLDDYEKKLTIAELDTFFGAVREKSVPLIQKIAASGKKIRKDFLNRSFPTEGQKRVSYKLLGHIGFDLEAGVLAESEHPFTMDLSPGDVRLTTHFYERNLTSAILSTIHEGGHGLYEQHAKASPIVSGSLLDSGVSMGIHESQSRFYENILGRSQGFWEYVYPMLAEEFPEQLKDVTADEFCQAINLSAPGLIRIEADELTYNLHIMIRYELEKALMEDQIQVDDLPKLWNEKYGEYLNIIPHNDSVGVMQDVHWSGGMIGYFPSYALGNAYGAQLANTMKKAVDIEAACRKGDLSPISGWLNEHIHQYGELKTPGQLIQDATGEKLNPTYLTDYLEEKFSKIYF